VFHHVSAKHISRYLSEFAWRHFNNRENEGTFEAHLGRCEQAKLPYAALAA